MPRSAPVPPAQGHTFGHQPALGDGESSMRLMGWLPEIASLFTHRRNPPPAVDFEGTPRTRKQRY